MGDIKGFGPGELYEEEFSLVKNTRGRRGSFTNSAFPEHHNKSKIPTVKEPDYLLVLTRSKTDVHGRRFKVCVPLIPPPTGERFEGGYHVEKNPITGGFKLVGPAPVKTENPWKKIFSSKPKHLPVKKKCVKRAAAIASNQQDSKTLLGAVKPNTKKPKRPSIDISKLTTEMEKIELDGKKEDSEIEAGFHLTSQTIEHRRQGISDQSTRKK